MSHTDLQRQLAAILDQSGFIPGQQADERYCPDWSRARGQPLALEGFDAVTALLTQCRKRLGPRLNSFEVMWQDFFDISTGLLKKGRPGPTSRRRQSAPVGGRLHVGRALHRPGQKSTSALLPLCGRNRNDETDENFP